MTSAIGPKTFDHVDRSGGPVAFEVTGSGPLIVCVPGWEISDPAIGWCEAKRPDLVGPGIAGFTERVSSHG